MTIREDFHSYHLQSLCLTVGVRSWGGVSRSVPGDCCSVGLSLYAPLVPPWQAAFPEPGWWVGGINVRYFSNPTLSFFPLPSTPSIPSRLSVRPVADFCSLSEARTGSVWPCALFLMRIDPPVTGTEAVGVSVGTRVSHQYFTPRVDPLMLPLPPSLGRRGLALRP